MKNRCTPAWNLKPRRSAQNLNSIIKFLIAISSSLFFVRPPPAVKRKKERKKSRPSAGLPAAADA